MPKISVIVPVYRAETFIERCIASVQAQILTDWELILVNDASPDNSMAIIKEIAEKDDRIRYIDNEENHGPMVVRHQGAKQATGDYITFLDSDDWLPETSLSSLYKKAIETGADIVCGHFIFVNGITEIEEKTSKLKYGNDKVGAFRSILNREVNQNLCSKLYKKEIFQDYEYIILDHSRYAEDVSVLFQSIAHIGSIAILDNGIYFYYTNPNSTTHKASSSDFESICKNTIIREKILREYKELEEDAKRYFTNNLYLDSIRKDNAKIIREYGLGKYISIMYIMKYVALDKQIKLLVKRLLRPIKQY